MAATKKAAEAKEAEVEDRIAEGRAAPDPHTQAGTLAEEAAVAEAMADRVEATDAGPVLHVPTSVEEATEVANREQRRVNEATGQAAAAAAPPRPGVEPPNRRIRAWDGPLNTNERNSFDPPKPDLTTTEP